MVRYCGTCGANLDTAAFAAGRCSVCGAEIDASRPAPGRDEALHSENSTQAAFVPTDATIQLNETPGRPLPARRRMPAVWMISLIAAVALLLAGTGVLALAHFSTATPSPSSDLGSGDGSSSISGAGAAAFTVTPAPGQTAVSTRLPAASGSPTPAAAGSPTGGGGTPTPLASGSPTAGDGTATSSPTAAPTPTPAPAFLSVSPTKITIVICSSASERQFTISNTGGKALLWSASKSVSTYAVSPSYGTIDVGLQVVVTVSDISQSGIITVSGLGAANSPQQVQMTCTL